LNISDNGIGIKDKRENSFGLHGMEQRVKSLQGALSITSIHGTNLAISIPKDINHD
jgi:signal transduction histidine kinase